MRIAAFERDKQKTTNLLTTTQWGERKATCCDAPGFNSASSTVLECFDFELLLWRVEFNGKERERADNRVKNLADKSMGFHLSGSVWTCFLPFTGSRMKLTKSGSNQSQMYVHKCDSSPRLVTPCSDDNYLDKEEYCRDLSCPESLFVTANVSTTIIAKEHKLGVALLFLYPGSVWLTFAKLLTVSNWEAENCFPGIMNECILIVSPRLGWLPQLIVGTQRVCYDIER